MIVKRRTFEAKKFQPGSAERIKLNESCLTSAYYPSYRYVVCEDNGEPTYQMCRTKTDALAKADGEN